jgi:DNA-binding CsgD family transcriptional regulator
MSAAFARRRLSDVVKDLGNTVVDPSLWPEMMERICAAMGAEGAMLMQGEARTPDVPCTASVKEGLKLYFEHGWHNRDLLARGVPRLLANEKVYATQDVVTRDELDREPFFHEVLYQHGVRWSAIVGINAGPALWCMSLQRTDKQGLFAARDKSLLTGLSERLTEVATLSSLVGHGSLLNMLNALELICQPAIAVDCFGRVRETNAAAEALFGMDIRIRLGQLFIADQRARTEVANALSRLCLLRDTVPLACAPIIVSRKNGPPAFIRVLPLAGAARSPFRGAQGLLLLSDSSRKLGADIALIARSFGLSPSEAKVAGLLADGQSTEEIAASLGLSNETIRSHLKSVFAKTGAHRQAELVALLARLPLIAPTAHSL